MVVFKRTEVSFLTLLLNSVLATSGRPSLRAAFYGVFNSSL